MCCEHLRNTLSLTKRSLPRFWGPNLILQLIGSLNFCSWDQMKIKPDLKISQDSQNSRLIFNLDHFGDSHAQRWNSINPSSHTAVVLRFFFVVTFNFSWATEMENVCLPNLGDNYWGK